MKGQCYQDLERPKQPEWQLVTTHPVKKSDLGFHGNLFGGKLLAWLDAAGAAFAAQVCDTPRIVTVAIDRCEFKRPAKEGQMIKMYARVNTIGTTSIRIEMEARSHSVYNGAQSPVLTTDMTFVRIDEQGDAIPISERVKRKWAHS